MGLSNTYLQSRIKELEEKIKILEKNKSKKFGLVWEEKTEDVVEKCKENIPILKLKNKTKEIEPILILDKDKPENILIEGDNYEALNVLNYTHKGKIDVIYIDPPYNTGNTDWRYNNDYVDGSDEWRHSKWISLMSNRLKIAKNLLTESGIICVAIDDYEIYTIGLLLTEIFGFDNKIGQITIQHHPRGRTQSNTFSTTHEYAIFFAKDKSKLKTDFCFPDDRDEEIESLIRSREDATPESRPNLFYPLYVNDNGNVSIESNKEYKNIIYPNNRNGNRVWKLVKESLQEEIDNNLIFAKKTRGEWNIYRRIKRELTNKSKTIWTDSKYDANTHGTNIIKDIFGESVFDFPKSIYTLKDIVFLLSKNLENSIILDFFAGSGTTGHAVLELNKDDGGNRKFILCTNNENKIAEEVTYERIKRVMKGYKNKKGEKVEGLGGNLKYFKTAFVDKDKLEGVNDETKLKLTYEVGEMIALKEDTLNEVENNDYWQIFRNLKEGKITAIYFKEDKEKLGDLVKKLEDYIDDNKPKSTKNNSEKIDGVKVALYVFSWTKNKYRNEYGSEDIRVEDIPEPILEVYKEINKI